MNVEQNDLDALISSWVEDKGFEEATADFERVDEAGAAISSQITAWQISDTVEQRAQRGSLADLDEVVATAPDSPPVAGDEK